MLMICQTKGLSHAFVFGETCLDLQLQGDVMHLLESVLYGHDDLHLHHVSGAKVVGSDAVHRDLLVMHLPNLSKLLDEVVRCSATDDLLDLTFGDVEPAPEDDYTDGNSATTIHPPGAVNLASMI